ncbi:MAG TPA: hypothetical protein VH933_16790 [Aestuariivirgaceae bacterium]|jgi:hypothetical protein
MFLKSVGEEMGLHKAELSLFRKLSSPEKIQSFVTQLRCNFERGGDTCHSVRTVILKGEAHCIEAALFAACALLLHGRPALLMDLQAEGDDDHVVALFRRGPYWGAISKSNTVWLRFRDPIYRTLRELAMSYFHEYVRGPRKTLRTYSRPFRIEQFHPALWVTSRQNCWKVTEALDGARHYHLVSSSQARSLRLRDSMERRIGRIPEFAC